MSSNISLLPHFPQWRIQDPCYGLKQVPSFFTHLFDTDIFQHMHDIKQTGLAYLVYPGASHSRFSHSLGVGFLCYDLLVNVENAARMDKKLLSLSTSSKSKCYKPLTDKDRICILTAAFCHDLGHPAFSHLFEQFMRENGRAGWSHETASKLLVRELWDGDRWNVRGKIEEEYNRFVVDSLSESCESSDSDKYSKIIHFTPEDLTFILELIDLPKKTRQKLRLAERNGTLHEEWGKHIAGRGIEYAWCYEIVSNWRGGMDVDRLDYFIRDAKQFKIDVPIDYERFLKGLRVVGYEYSSEADNHNDSLTSVTDSSPRCVSCLASPRKDRDIQDYTLFKWRKESYPRMYRHSTYMKQEKILLRAMKILKEQCVNREEYSSDSVSPFQTILRYSDLNNSGEKNSFDVKNYLRLTDAFVLQMIKNCPRAEAYWQLLLTERNLLVNGGMIDWGKSVGKILTSSKSKLALDSYWTKDSCIDRLRELVIQEVLLMQSTSSTGLQRLSLLTESDLRGSSDAGFPNLIFSIETYHCGDGVEDPMTDLIWYDNDSQSKPGKESTDCNSVLSEVYQKQDLFLYFDAPKKCLECGKIFQPFSCEDSLYDDHFNLRQGSSEVEVNGSTRRKYCYCSDPSVKGLAMVYPDKEFRKQHIGNKLLKPALVKSVQRLVEEMTTLSTTSWNDITIEAGLKRGSVKSKTTVSIASSSCRPSQEMNESIENDVSTTVVMGNISNTQESDSNLSNSNLINFNNLLTTPLNSNTRTTAAAEETVLITTENHDVNDQIQLCENRSSSTTSAGNIIESDLKRRRLDFNEYISR